MTLSELGYATYTDYLYGRWWTNRKKKHYQKKKNRRCFICHDLTELQVHHRTYTTLGEERDRDLITLCRKHHEEITFYKGRKITNEYVLQSREECVLKKNRFPYKLWYWLK